MEELEKNTLRKIKREIIKSAKKGDVHYWWELDNLLTKIQVDNITTELEKMGYTVKNKNDDFKIIRW